MKLVVAAVCLTLFVAVSAEESSPERVPSAYDYHRRIGIPRAAEIKKWEDENVGKIDNQRIVGGWHVDVSQHPHQAGLLIHLHGNALSICGGSLISHHRVVTAAHCWGGNAHTITVVVGSNFIFHGGHRTDTSSIVIYPGWNPDNLHADVAVVITSHIPYSHVVQPISLPQGDELHWDFNGWWSTATGFGATSNGGGIPNDQRISAVDLQVLSHGHCAGFYGHWYHGNNICTSGYGGRGICGGDSGGPLTTEINGRRVLIGASSYVSWNGCQAGDPAVYARITSFVHWIWSV